MYRIPQKVGKLYETKNPNNISIYLRNSCIIRVVYAVTLYQAKEVAYDNSNSGSTSTDVQSALDELYNKVNNIEVPEVTLLWENPSPKSNFNAQTLDIDYTPYDYLLIAGSGNITKDLTSAPFLNGYALIPAKFDSVSWFVFGYHDFFYDRWYGDLRQRYLKFKTNDIYISDAILYNQGVSNSYTVPIKIYGIKGDFIGVDVNE